MTEEEISKKVAAFLGTDAPVITEESVEETVEVAPQPTDVWQERQHRIRDYAPRQVRGASPRLSLDMTDLLDRGIKDAYKKAIDDSELLRAEGDLQNAQIVEQQYMQDWFYPTVDALIRMNSEEELLAAQDVLEALDGFVLMPNGLRADGYTSMFVSSLYEPTGTQIFSTDAEVRRNLRRINELCDQRQIRAASALAAKVQQDIDSGQNRATPEDYEFIQRIALRGI